MKKVFTSSKIAECDLVVSFLEAAGVKCTIRNEMGSNAIGEGFPIANMPAMTFAWPEIWVGDEDVADAEAIIAARTDELSEAQLTSLALNPQAIGEGIYVPPPPPGQGPRSSRLPALLAGMLIGAVLTYLGIWQVNAYRNRGTWHHTADTDHDGRVDEWTLVEDGETVRSSLDANRDGKADTTIEYSRGRIVTVSMDTDFQGADDVTYFYSNNIVQRGEWHPNGQLPLWKLETYSNGLLTSEMVDRNDDGRLDHEVLFDWRGEIRTERELTP